MSKLYSGAEIVFKCLEDQDVEFIFGYPGGAVLPIYDELKNHSSIKHILVRHEQGAGHAAEGYARSSGKPGVVLVTSGPGATNVVTALTDAYMDSVPLVCISGQVPTHLIGTDAFQECDTTGITRPCTKHNWLVKDIKDLPKILHEAFQVATTGRPGPVLVDIPKDVQFARTNYSKPKKEKKVNGKIHNRFTQNEIDELVKLISKAKKPVLYTGGGVISSEAQKELKRFAELTGLPVTHTLMGLGAFDPDHEQSLYWYGMHGTVAGNWAVCESDLLICAGARFDDRITGLVSKYAPDAYVIHFDVDQSEHSKNVHAHFPIKSDIKHALKRMSELIEEDGFDKPELGAWMTTLSGWKKDYPFKYKKGEHITSQEAIDVLYKESKGDAIITTGVGQHQMWAAQYYRFKEPRTYISSLGLGTMGFGYPAAIGAKVARPDKEVIDIDGDGSFLMNVQELATAKIEKINAKCLLLNNQHLGMVVQWEDRFYESVRGHTILCDPENIGGPENLDAIYPDYIKMCEGFGVKARRVSKREDLQDAMREMLDADEPYLLEVIVPFTEHVLPMIPQGKSAKEMLID